jgi:hypothetical protein
VVNQHRGWIEVRAPSARTRFDIFLPAVRKPRSREPPSETELASNAATSFILSSGRSTPAPDGAHYSGEVRYRVVEAARRQALETWRSIIRDLSVLTDMVMPDAFPGANWHTASELKRPDLKVVYHERLY